MNKQIIKKVQGDIGVDRNPLTKEEIKFIRKAKKTGALRRFGVILNHRRVGFTSNCMVAWAVPSDEVKKIGKRLAKLDRISHCYERPIFKDFPYNVYTMIHGKSKKELIDLVKKIRNTMKIKQFAMLWSIKEFKKTSPIYVV